MNTITVRKSDPATLPMPYREVIADTDQTTLVAYVDNRHNWYAVSDGRILEQVIRWRIPATSGFPGSIPR